jgi:hypothetical protein
MIKTLFIVFFFTAEEHPVNVCKQFPDFASHMRMEISKLPEMMLLPSGEN